MAYRQTEMVAKRLEENRRRILKAARKLVAEGGFSNAPVSAVAKEAGLATGTIYRYFSSKEDLCRQVFRETSAGEMNRLAGIATSDLPALQRFERIIRTFAGRAIKGRRQTYALLAEPVDQALNEERARFRKTHAAIFRRVIEDAIAEGSVPPCNAQLAAACIAGAIPTALVGPLAHEPSAAEGGDNAALEALVQFCMGAIGAPVPHYEVQRTMLEARP